MGIEDPGWSKVIIVIAFLAFMILTLYYVKGQGRGLITKLHQNKLLSIEETIAISNICRASIITADQSRFLIIHGKGQTSTAVMLSNKDNHVTNLNNKDLSILNNNKANEFEKV
jgi:hypothetical protein